MLGCVGLVDRGDFGIGLVYAMISFVKVDGGTGMGFAVFSAL